MLKSLIIQHCFAHTNTRIDFKDGLTAITGPNGTGKSQILEMIRFALWGVSALRTEAEDYKKAKVQLDFEVRGVAHQVYRTTGSARLSREGDLVCTGTRPVNAKLIEIFGYGLAVFDTANVANQGSIEALSAMRAGERKKLVDNTIGLNLIDDLIKFCADEARSRTAELAGLQRALVAPTEPIEPRGYRPAPELAAERGVLLGEADRAKQLQGRLLRAPKPLPEPLCSEPRDLSTLLSMDGEREASLGRVRGLATQLAALPRAEITSDELAERKLKLLQRTAYANAVKFLLDNSIPDVALEEVNRQHKLVDEFSSWCVWSNLTAAGYHECPKCKTRTPLKAEAIRESGVGHWEGQPKPEKPRYALHELTNFRKRWEFVEANKAEYTTSTLLANNPMPTVPYTESNILLWERGLLDEEHRDHVASLFEEAEQELNGREDVKAAILARKQYERMLRTYEEVEEQRKQIPAWEKELASLEGGENRLAALDLLQSEVMLYDRLRDLYNGALVVYEKKQEETRVLETEAGQFNRARAALIEIKTKVKTYLVPSLSTVASSILQRMTSGALSDVEVSEEFDIRVDGINIDGLSGAGKAAANLALRIGLGQVLTNRVFSVFMADEVDQSMDDERAEATAKCLRNLTGSIKQVVLVSHKKPYADNIIHT